MSKKEVNVIGYGFIGQATAIGLERLGYRVSAYDISKKPDIYKQKEFKKIPLMVGGELPKSGINIICIAEKVLKDGKQETDHIKKVLENLGGTIILRTTILPKFLKDLKFDFYWPEFLHERKAIEEFMNPELVVIGRRTGKRFPFEKYFRPVFYCSPEEASHIKYLGNIWNAMRIAFVNEFGDNLIKEKIDQKRILDFFFKKQKYLRWGNAFGGHCHPKDTRAYLRKYPHLSFLAATVKANEIHKGKYPRLRSIY